MMVNDNPGWWFQPTPLKNMSSSVGMMKFPTEWKVIKNVPNHQAGLVYSGLILSLLFFPHENHH